MSAVVRNEKLKGYQARIGKARGYRSRFFSDKKAGGKRRAKQLALDWLEEEGEPYVGPRKVGPRKEPQTNSSTGVNGVYHTVERKKNGTELPYYAAAYTIGPTGKMALRHKRFGYGPTTRSVSEAFELACNFRREYEEAYAQNGVKGVKEFWKRWAEREKNLRRRKAAPETAST
jgi:hypothetical protein